MAGKKKRDFREIGNALEGIPLRIHSVTTPKPKRRVDAYTFMRRQSGRYDTSYPASDPRSDHYEEEVTCED